VNLPGSGLNARGLDGPNLLLAERLANNVQAMGQRSVAEAPVLFLPGKGERITPVRVFSGLVSSAWARARRPPFHGVFWHQLLQLGLGKLVLAVGGAGAKIAGGEASRSRTGEGVRRSQRSAKTSSPR